MQFLLPNCFLRLASTIIHLLIQGFELLLVLNFRLSNLSPCIISPYDDDDGGYGGGKTVMQFWIPTEINPEKPNLILIHGFGGSSIWQFFFQIWHLSKRVNLFVPDLLFFGNSYSVESDRSEEFQARCVVEGMKKLGVKRFSVVGISYGGYVSYRIGEMYPKEVEKIVIVSSGICYSEEQKVEYLKRFGKSPLEFLVPENCEDLRYLLKVSMHRADWIIRFPDIVLQQAIDVVLKQNRKEKREIIKYLLNREADSKLGILSQETLVIWGDKDNFFPIEYAYQLQRHLEPRARVQVIKDAGHALNFDAPFAMSNYIISFLQQ